MELRAYLTILWRRKWVIVIATLVTSAVVVAGTLLATPIYAASTTLRIATAADASVNYTDYMYADRLINTYAKIATSGPVLAELVDRLNLGEPPQVSVEIVPDTELLKINVENPSPALASTAANRLAEILIAQSEGLYGGEKSAQQILRDQVAQVEEELNQAREEYEKLIAQSPDQTERIAAASQSIELKQQIYGRLLEQYEQARVTEALRANTLSVVEPATIPKAPSEPRVALNVTLGVLVGLIGGVGLAFLFENLDTRLYTTEQIEAAAALPALGRIPSSRKQGPAIYLNGSPEGEALRHLRTNIFAIDAGAPKTLLVTSAEPGEGKSTIAIGLALAIAQSGRHVALVDADLRRPALHKIFDCPNEVGLSSVVRQRHVMLESEVPLNYKPGRGITNVIPHLITVDEALQSSSVPGLKLLTSGPLPPNPSEWLGSPNMITLLDKLKQRFDVIVLDTPSLMAVTDAAVMAPFVDAVLLVVGLAQARGDAVQAACRHLKDVNARSIGLVVNRAGQDGHYSHVFGAGEQPEA